MNPRIEILIDPAGATTVQTLGFTGASCREASRFLERALGTRVERRLTAEFHQNETAKNAQRQGSG